MTSDILKRTAEAKLLPCPFCGSAAKLHDNSEAFVACTCCGVAGFGWESSDMAIAAWNRRIPDMATAIAERDAENARLTARAEAAEALLAAATGMVSIVEGIDGVMNHGVWRDERGMRLKDTPEWVSLYIAHAAMKEGR